MTKQTNKGTIDENPIAPFPMYTDEYILWMETRQPEKNSKKDLRKFLLYVAIGVLLLSALLYFVFDVYLLISILLPIFVIFVPCVLVSLFTSQSFSKEIIYYVTNYRLIELNKHKNSVVKYGYLAELENVTISSFDDKQNNIEFTWKDKHSDSVLCHGFFFISNTKEIYDIILEQKEKLEDNPVTFDYIEQ